MGMLGTKGGMGGTGTNRGIGVGESDTGMFQGWIKGNT